MGVYRINIYYLFIFVLVLLLVIFLVFCFFRHLLLSAVSVVLCKLDFECSVYDSLCSILISLLNIFFLFSNRSSSVDWLYLSLLLFFFSFFYVFFSLLFFYLLVFLWLDMIRKEGLGSIVTRYKLVNFHSIESFV